MRILSVTHNLGRGGTQRVVQNFSLAYRRAGHEVAVLAHNAGGERRQPLESAGIPVFVGDRDVNLCASLAAEFRPDVCHIHRAGLANGFETQLMARLKGIGSRILETNVFARVDYSEGAELIDVHLQLSAWCMWRWRKWLGPRSSGTAGVVLPNPIDPNAFAPSGDAEAEACRARLDVPPGAYVCGRIGQPNISNWHPATLHAFATLAQRDPNAFMLLLGLPREMEPALQKMLPEHRRRIRLLPLTTNDAELSAIYSAMDCFVHAAYAGESFGLVLTEAMLCGCPVITASRPHKSNSQVEVVGHLRGGLVAASTASLPEAVVTLREDARLRESIRGSVRQWVVERFAVDPIAAQALQVADLTLRHHDRKALQLALAEAGLKTSTSDDEVRGLLANLLGKPKPAELLGKQLVHRPLPQRVISCYLRWKAGI